MRHVFKDNLNATDIYVDIRNSIIEDARLKDYTYVIMGKSGPTGKTRMRERLSGQGLNAVELSECIFDVVTYGDSNRYCIDHMQKTVVIILNQIIEKGERK